jgi:hypothetical protein
MPTVGTSALQYEVMAGSPTFSFARDDFSKQEEWKMTWNDAKDLAAVLYPPPKWVGGFLVAQPPLSQSISVMGNTVVLVADAASFEPFNKDFVGGQAEGEQWAKVNVTFKLRNDDEEEETLLSHSITIGGEFMTLPNSQMLYKTTGNPVANEDIKAAKVVPSLEHSMEWNEVPQIPYSAIRSCIGCVNGGSFFGAAAETLLFSGADISRQVTTDGTKPWKVSYKFSEKGINAYSGLGGWNHFYDPLNDRWDYLVSSVNGAKVYETRNFSTLFQGS